MGLFEKIFGSYSEKELKRIQPLLDQVLALEQSYDAMTDAELIAQTGILKERLKQGATLDDILPEAFATCREASWRVLNMKHFPVQIIGGIVLHQGRIAEMRTGEGKTLVATLPAYLNGLSGNGVHVITVNDYLAKRDSEWMGKVYRFLGLTVGLVTHDTQGQEKKAAYAADITYGTNNEFGFDYLRDNMVTYREEQVQRSHQFAIVDEVDSILIDEARTPLIISGHGDQSTELYTLANQFALTLSAHTVVEIDQKEEQDDIEADYIIDEKGRNATLTPQGVKRAEKYFQVENLMDGENITLQHHINQAIRANGIMKRDVDYVVKDGEVLIVDEFTGRLMIGRRYNEGLHQAIEAKEGVKVARESKTLATITFQNYFRLYKKLSGMTGTGRTEEAEFREIYKLDVIEIPTNKPIARIDEDDVVYKTVAAKYNAVIDQIVACHEKGQPVLVGTVNIDRSEHLSSLLKRRGVKHEVLNAKYHEKEAEIISQAGKYGAVTIATNMAGRGTDIMLGGNAEYLAKRFLKKQGYSEELIMEADGFSETEDPDILEIRALYETKLKEFKAEIDQEAARVREVGGLYIIGTERHESRRIDNQLRGRAGRQGDPGTSRFYLSLEDELMRLFGGERIGSLMNTLKIDEDMPIETKLLTRSIEGAQKKVESRNFETRKSVLRYDDVMNKQRTTIYAQRAKVLDGEDVHGYIETMITDSIAEVVDRYLPPSSLSDDWNLEGLRDYYLGYLTTEDDLSYTKREIHELDRNEVLTLLHDRAKARYDEREEKLGQERMRDLERAVLLSTVDRYWMEHIDNMAELKQGIHLRSYAQKDPVVEYQVEGFEMFDEMVSLIREDTVKVLLTLKIAEADPEEPAKTPLVVEKRSSSISISKTTAFHGESQRTVKKTARPTVTGEKVGRNDPCPCGSGKKYKKCCGATQEVTEPHASK